MKIESVALLILMAGLVGSVSAQPNQTPATAEATDASETLDVRGIGGLRPIALGAPHFPGVKLTPKETKRLVELAAEIQNREIFLPEDQSTTGDRFPMTGDRFSPRGRAQKDGSFAVEEILLTHDFVRCSEKNCFSRFFIVEISANGDVSEAYVNDNKQGYIALDLTDANSLKYVQDRINIWMSFSEYRTALRASSKQAIEKAAAVSESLSRR